jgi:hypothetical protein
MTEKEKMIAGEYYNAGDANWSKTAGVLEFTTSIERNRIPNKKS